MLNSEVKSPLKFKKALYAILQATPCTLGAALVSLTLILTFFFCTLPAEGADGRGLFKAKCISCHSIEKPRTRPTIEESLSEKGPPLWYAGSKYQEGFIASWLQDPKPLRGMEYNSLTEEAAGGHIALKAAEAAGVAAYLQSLTTPDLLEEVEIKPKATVRGRFIYVKKLGCYGCHTTRRNEKIIGGLTGPTLIGTADRLNPQWIYSYIKNPGAFTTLSPMPDYSGMLSEVKLKALVAYIAAQK